MTGMTRRAMLLCGVAASVTACSKFMRYDGPRVTRVEVQKANRRMYLMHHDQVLEAFEIQLGFTAEGHKQFEGDGRTPEGRYRIEDVRNRTKIRSEVLKNLTKAMQDSKIPLASPRVRIEQAG